MELETTGLSEERDRGGLEPAQAALALQLLPLGTGNRLEVIDKIIYRIREVYPDALVTPFETVMEGNLEDLLALLQELIVLAGEEHDNVFANVKINYGRILSSRDKIEKFAD